LAIPEKCKITGEVFQQLLAGEWSEIPPALADDFHPDNPNLRVIEVGDVRVSISFLPAKKAEKFSNWLLGTIRLGARPDSYSWRIEGNGDFIEGYSTASSYPFESIDSTNISDFLDFGIRYREKVMEEQTRAVRKSLREFFGLLDSYFDIEPEDLSILKFNGLTIEGVDGGNQSFVISLGQESMVWSFWDKVSRPDWLKPNLEQKNAYFLAMAATGPHQKLFEEARLILTAAGYEEEFFPRFFRKSFREEYLKYSIQIVDREGKRLLQYTPSESLDRGGWDSSIMIPEHLNLKKRFPVSGPRISPARVADTKRKLEKALKTRNLSLKEGLALPTRFSLLTEDHLDRYVDLAVSVTKWGYQYVWCLQTLKTPEGVILKSGKWWVHVLEKGSDISHLDIGDEEFSLLQRDCTDTVVGELPVVKSIQIDL
jgi:hypothetical protein